LALMTLSFSNVAVQVPLFEFCSAFHVVSICARFY
jgi:hypothetical protein